MFDFAAQETGELEFRKGEIITGEIELSTLVA